MSANLFTKNPSEKGAANASHNANAQVTAAVTKNKLLFDNAKKVIGQLSENLPISEIAQLFGLNIEESGIQFPMKNGRMETFDLITIETDQILQRTTVHISNAREQDALNSPEALSDIIPSLTNQGNFLPGVANISENATFEVMDGSRRRMACVHARRPYRLYVPRNQISVEDAKYVADLCLLHKALSYREKGAANLKIMEENGFEEVADLASYLFGINYQKSDYELLRLQNEAASIPLVLCELMPDFNNLSVREYKSLSKIANHFDASESNLPKEFLEFVSSAKVEIAKLPLDPKVSVKQKQKDYLKSIVGLFNQLKSKSNETVSDKPTKEVLQTFNYRNKKITKVTSKDKVSIVFARPDKDLLNKIEKLISEHYQNQNSEPA